MTTRSTARVLVALLLALSFAPDAGAQALDNTWYKVKVKAKGAILRADGEVDKAKAKTVFYVLLELNDEEGTVGGATYNYGLVIETSPGIFTPTSLGQLRTEGVGEPVMLGEELGPAAAGIHWQIVLPDENGTTLQLHFVARVKTSFTKKGELRKASFKSIGGIIPSGTTAGDNVIGVFKLRAKLIAEEDLPFSV